MPAAKETSFEVSMQKLGSIVEKMESGDLSLDESLKLYEEGTRLSQTCMKRLEDAQQKIEVLMRTASGGLQASEADPEDFKPKKKKKKS